MISLDTGLNPYWNETFNLKIQCPQLALIQFSVCDVNPFGEKVLLGESTIPVINYKDYNIILITLLYLNINLTKCFIIGSVHERRIS